MIRLGQGALALLMLLVFGAVAALFTHADWPVSLGPGDAAAIRFTLLQSTLSAAISVLVAIPLARALARRQFPGRGLLIAGLGAPFILPAIVAVFGLLAIWGRSGIVSQGLDLIGQDTIDIFGLSGVVLAHVFFNLPLATRLILSGWSAIPSEHFRLTAQLGLTARQEARLLELPMLRSVLPGAFMLIFILCMTSFAIVLALGGGPKATSVELAIYAALRFDFDLGRAAILAMIQLGLSVLAAICLLGIGRPVDLGRGAGAARLVWRKGGAWTDAACITLAALFLFAPIAAVVLRGIAALAGVLDTRLLAALTTSLGIAAMSTALAVGGGLAIAHLAVRTRRGAVVEILAAMVLVVSPFVLGTGLFILINPIADPFALAIPVTALVNAALSLPFCLRVLTPALLRVETQYGRLADSLALSGRNRFWQVTWPGVRAPLGFSAGLAAAFSMGDLGVIALFAPLDGESLPLLMYRLMGAYRMGDAAAVALVLVGLSFALFALCDWGGRHGRHL